MVPKDEPPTTVTEPEPEPSTPPPPAPESPEPEKVAKEEGEKVPAWGEALMDQVSALGDTLNAVLTGGSEPPGGKDETPVRKPWHKRNPFGGD